jgi:hypothetical protein
MGGFMRLLFSLIFISSLLISTPTRASYPESDHFTTTSIPNQYIVVLKPEFSTSNFEIRANEKVLKKYSILNGMLIETTNDPNTLKRNGVSYVEPNLQMHILSQQSNPPWGLDRIDAHTGLDNLYHYSATGYGVQVYVIDTGLLATHTEFTNRIGKGFSALPGDSKDCNGHGTHVSGTIAGSTYGVAKQAIIHPVKVLDCNGSGSTDNVISGIEWVATNASLPAVANMSLGGDKLQSINDAVSAAIAKGIVFVVAAGNFSADACNYSPASTPNVISVAASDQSDVSASFTNYGSCVKVYAPGVSILSAGISDNNSSATMSGTSMASPHVTGVVAQLLQLTPSAKPTAIVSQLINKATRGVLSSVPSNTPNLMLYSEPKDSPTPPSDPGAPSECSDSWACYTASNSLNPTTYYDQQPKSPIVVNYARPIKIYVKGDADFDIFLYYSNNGGQSWTTVAQATATGYAESLTYQANDRGLYTAMIMLKTSGTSGTYSAWIVK